ncbi:hypothetical protein CBR_g12892 [Chara braunii]|uniref:Uncharacterized protein n=1 Tax=Chara braunii TaxID=69332 RepID=A0A388KSY4_CHABU|nr:hypothetical protein CBR_g12892 [Chara braunii]|eukprot:GBG73174.1 hypothetical protein CBR_g12892 [Chara braunii]
MEGAKHILAAVQAIADVKFRKLRVRKQLPQRALALYSVIRKIERKVDSEDVEGYLEVVKGHAHDKRAERRQFRKHQEKIRTRGDEGRKQKSYDGSVCPRLTVRYLIRRSQAAAYFCCRTRLILIPSYFPPLTVVVLIGRGGAVIVVTALPGIVIAAWSASAGRPPPTLTLTVSAMRAGTLIGCLVANHPAVGRH